MTGSIIDLKPIRDFGLASRELGGIWPKAAASDWMTSPSLTRRTGGGGPRFLVVESVECSPWFMPHDRRQFVAAPLIAGFRRRGRVRLEGFMGRLIFVACGVALALATRLQQNVHTESRTCIPTFASTGAIRDGERCFRRS
jgi:hypothetical protein